MIIFERLIHAWNAFKTPPDDYYIQKDLGISSSFSPTISHHSGMFERSIIYSLCNRIAMDVAAYDIQHVKVDKNTKRYIETMDSGLNNCLTVDANVDQTGRGFIQDVVMSMFDEGTVAIVPVDTDLNPTVTGAYEIKSLRTAKIREWYPNHVKVWIYNDRKGEREDLILPKSMVAIVENPLYAIMNEPNSTLKRLVRKLILLDAVDEQSASGKLDLIIQLPYVIKTELRQKQAEERRKAIEDQLAGSKYGIAYIDGTEHITQLNRASENNLLAQVTYLTTMLYNQLGISESVFNGTADEQAMLNYYDRTVEPVATALIDEMKRKFLTKTARSQGQTIMGFRDVFRLIPANEIAEVADVFARNEILTPNEVRAILGMKPAEDSAADELRNRNMPLDATMGYDENGVPVDQNGSQTVPPEDPGLSREEVTALMDQMAAEYERTINELLDEMSTTSQSAMDEAISEQQAEMDRLIDQIGEGA